MAQNNAILVLFSINISVHLYTSKGLVFILIKELGEVELLACQLNATSVNVNKSI